MPSWEVALGCAGKRKKSELAPDAPTSRRTFTEDVTTCHLYSGCEIPFPLEEAAVSAAPTREGSFRGMHRSSVPEVPLFSATPRQTDLDLASENAEVVPWTATCSACCAPITGTVYMGFDRAFCSAAACHRGLTATGFPLPIRVRVPVLWAIDWHWATPRHTTPYLRAFFATRRCTSSNAGCRGLVTADETSNAISQRRRAAIA